MTSVFRFRTEGIGPLATVLVTVAPTSNCMTSRVEA
jgi:hypothetical protein